METTDRYLAFIGYLKRKIENEPISDDELAVFALDIAKEIDRDKVNGKSTLVLERLYEEVMWLKCDVLGGEEE